MKKGGRKLLVLLFCFFQIGVLVIFGVNFIIDPYNEFSLFDHKRFAQSHETTPYQLYRLLKTEAYPLVFGTSHSMTMSSELFKEKILNVSGATYGAPIDVFFFLTKMDKRQLSNIKKIYYLVDHTDRVFEPKSSIYEEADLNSTTEFICKTLLNISKKKLIDAIETVIKNVTGNYTTFIKKDGSVAFLSEKIIDKNYTFKKKVKFYSSEQQLEYLKNIDLFCKKNGIEIIYFKSVFSKLFLKNSDWLTVEHHFENIVDQIDIIYSLMYIEGISDNLNNFRDPTHHRIRVTETELEILDSPDLKEKYKINKKNVTQYLKKIKKNVFAE